MLPPIPNSPEVLRLSPDTCTALRSFIDPSLR
jgi:hypothetical protein